MDILCALDNDLLEGPAWDPRDGTLLLVDLKRGELITFGWADARVGRTSVLGGHASVFLPVATGGYLVAAGGSIRFGLRPGPPIESVAIDPGLRFNDGACDSRGRLWIGTMTPDAAAGAGALHCLEPDLSWRTVLTGVTISNGIGWSPDDRSMYYADTATGRVDVFDFDADDGAVSRRRTFVDTSPFAGMPDGLTVDAEGCVWVAFYGGAAVRRFAPDGRCLREVPMPVERPTSVCFAGPDLDTLVVTVRGDETDSSGRAHGASLYALAVDVAGLPTHPFSGAPS